MQQVYAQLVKQQQTKEVDEQEDEAKEEIADDEEEENKAEVDNKMSEKTVISSRVNSGRKSSVKRFVSQVSVKPETEENKVCCAVFLNWHNLCCDYQMWSQCKHILGWKYWMALIALAMSVPYR